MSIGVFSSRSGLSQKRLRSYAAVGLLLPTAVDPASGYRYYSPSQVREAKLIDALRRAGMPLLEIHRLVRHPSYEHLAAWERQLEADAEVRHTALHLARELLSIDDSPDSRPFRGGTMMKLHTFGRSEKGPVRENNEDAIVSGDLLAVVADGMGGLPGGEVAAHAATSLVRATFTGRSQEELEAAVRAANWAIWDRASGQPELTGMGTTICAAGIVDDCNLAVVHVGDSRAYLWHEGQLRQLTEDHTVTADLIRRGELSEEDARQHPHFGFLTQALGVAPDVVVSSGRFRVVPGDRAVLCSDGVVNELSQTEMAGAISGNKDVTALTDDLIELALARGARDNVSVVAAEVVT